MIKRVIIVGKSCSGKDTLRKRIERKFGMTYAVSYTSRPRREGEVEGDDYHFISDEVAEQFIEANIFFECAVFNGWYYGITKAQFKESHIFIMTPSGLKEVPEKDRKESLVVYLDMPRLLRGGRMADRNDDNDDITRRMLADEEDFKDFTDYDIKITNEDF